MYLFFDHISFFDCFYNHDTFIFHFIASWVFLSHSIWPNYDHNLPKTFGCQTDQDSENKYISLTTCFSISSCLVYYHAYSTMLISFCLVFWEYLYISYIFINFIMPSTGDLFTIMSIRIQ